MCLHNEHCLYLIQVNKSMTPGPVNDEILNLAKLGKLLLKHLLCYLRPNPVTPDTLCSNGGTKGQPYPLPSYQLNSKG